MSVISNSFPKKILVHYSRTVSTYQMMSERAFRSSAWDFDSDSFSIYNGPQRLPDLFAPFLHSLQLGSSPSYQSDIPLYVSASREPFTFHHDSRFQLEIGSVKNLEVHQRASFSNAEQLSKSTRVVMKIDGFEVAWLRRYRRSGLRDRKSPGSL